MNVENMKFNKVYVRDLVLEVTRKCDLKCGHCLRGDVQELNMEYELVRKIILEDSSWSFNSVVFSGGEPFLNPYIISYFIEVLDMTKNLRGNNKVENFESFYLKTNGNHESMLILTSLLKLYSMANYKDICSLEVSADGFHFPKQIPDEFDGVSFFNPPIKNEFLLHSNDWIINEGRAEQNEIGRRRKEDSALLYYFDYDDDADKRDIHVDTLYIAANGNVIGNCDCSFERIDNESMGNVYDDSIMDIVKRAITNDRAIQQEF